MRLLWLGAASFSGVLAGLCISASDYLALVWAALLLLGVAALARVVSGGERPRDLVALAICAGALHMAVGIGIQTVSTTFAGGFVTGDDAAYYRLASAFARYLQGIPLDPRYSPPLWGGDAYLFGFFVYIESALFLVFGPDVRILILLNSGLAIVTALLVFLTVQRLFGRAAAWVAAVIVAFLPSLILWSALNLKDALTIMLAVFAIWALVEFQARPHPITFLLPFIAAETLVTLRAYVAATVAIAALLSIAVTKFTPWRRVGATVVGVLLAAIVVGQSLIAIGNPAGDALLLAFERERAAMAVGARTAFVPPPTPVAASPAAQPDEIGLARARTLNYLPTGLAFALLAPFPLTARRIQEIVAAPEMLLWYLLVIASVATIWRERRRWVQLAPPALAIGGLLLVLALAEGNVGTLFRHRAMVMPFVAALASPSLVALWARRHTDQPRSGAAPVPG